MLTKSASNKTPKVAHDKPISLAPLSLEEALKGLLSTQPPPKSKAKKKPTQKRSAKKK